MSWPDDPSIEQRLVMALGWALQFVPPRVQKHPTQGQMNRLAHRTWMEGIATFIPQYEREENHEAG